MYASSVNAQFSVNLIKLMVEDKICSVNFYDKLSIKICIAFFLELVPDIRLLNKKHGFKNNLHMYGCVRIFSSVHINILQLNLARILNGINNDIIVLKDTIDTEA